MRKSKKNLPHRRLSGEELFESITAACAGLIYTSETDAPVLPFALPSDGANDDMILEKLSASASQAASVDPFFDRLTTKREWFGKSEIEIAAKFARLQKLLDENLSDLKLVRIGRLELSIVIAGRDSEGRLMGITTKAVET